MIFNICKKITFISFALLLLSCSQLRPINHYKVKPLVNEDSYIEKKTTDTIKNTFEFTSYNQAHNKVIALEQQWAQDPNSASKTIKAKQLKAYRDSISYDLMSYSDKVCNIHHAQILLKSNVWNVGMGGSSALFSQLGAITDKVGAATNWSAAASFFTASKELINSEILMDNLAPNLIAISQNLRNRQKLLIASKLSQDYDSFKFTQAIKSINEYHNSCSFYIAITEITKIIENQKPLENEVESKIKKIVDAVNYGIPDPANFKSANDVLQMGSPVSKELEKLFSQLRDAKNE